MSGKSRMIELAQRVAGGMYNVHLRSGAASSWDAVNSSQRKLAEAAGIPVEHVDVDRRYNVASFTVEGGIESIEKTSAIRATGLTTAVYVDPIDESGELIMDGGRPADVQKLVVAVRMTESER